VGEGGYRSPGFKAKIGLATLLGARAEVPMCNKKYGSDRE
jgi:hypothetical protein